MSDFTELRGCREGVSSSTLAAGVKLLVEAVLEVVCRVRVVGGAGLEVFGGGLNALTKGLC